MVINKFPNREVYEKIKEKGSLGADDVNVLEDYPGLEWKGEYSSTATYVKGDIVYYENMLYVMVSASVIGAIPGIDNEWRDFAKRSVTSSDVTNALGFTPADSTKVLPLSGGTLTGNLTGKYIIGTWLQATDAGHLATTPTKIPVFDDKGWIYYRTPVEILKDIGASSGYTLTEADKTEIAGKVVVPPYEYTVTNTLTGCTSSNAATTVTEGDSYYAIITASSGYTMSGATVHVKMGGTDVTALYYADGIINIPDVSGNIEITITAAVYVPTYTNVLPTAVDPSTKSGVWDGKGYRNGAYASSAKPYYGTDAAYWCTGAIALQPSDVIYVKGATLEGSGHARLGAFSGATGGCYFCKEYVALSGIAMVTKLGDKYYKIVLDHSYANYTNIGYIMFSAQGTGDGVVVTKNEAIE